MIFLSDIQFEFVVIVYVTRLNPDVVLLLLNEPLSCVYPSVDDLKQMLDRKSSIQVGAFYTVG